MTLLTTNKALRVATYNITPRSTCPGMSEFCERRCYTRKGKFLCPPTVASLNWRWQLTQDLDSFTESMISEIQARRIPIVRIHSAGDFYSVDYFRAWLDIAKACPDTRFGAYTRNWRVPGWREVLAESLAVTNFHLWFSTDPSTGVPEDWAQISYILDPKVGKYHASMPKPNCPKQLGGFACDKCKKCFGSRAKAVTFKLH